MTNDSGTNKKEKKRTIRLSNNSPKAQQARPRTPAGGGPKLSIRLPPSAVAADDRSSKPKSPLNRTISIKPPAASTAATTAAAAATTTEAAAATTAATATTEASATAASGTAAAAAGAKRSGAQILLVQQKSLKSKEAEKQALSSSSSAQIRTTSATSSIDASRPNTPSATSKPQPKMPYFDKTPPFNPNTTTADKNNPLFSSVNQVQIHHQSSSLHYCYNVSNGKWYYQGSTTIYLTLDTTAENDATNGLNSSSSSTTTTTSTTSKEKETTATATATVTSTSNDQKSIQMREIPLHLRHGQSITITNTKAYTPLPSTQSSPPPSSTTTTNTNTNDKNNNNTKGSTTTTKLLPLPRGYVSYFDPLHKIYTKKSNTFSAMEYMPNAQNKTRYECDGYSSVTGGGSTFMEEMRCGSIASNFGEMRIQATCPVGSNHGLFIGSQEERIKELWRDDLLESTCGEMKSDNHNDDSSNNSKDEKDKTLLVDNRDDEVSEWIKSNGGELELQLKRKCVERSVHRRKERIDLISSRLASNDLSIFAMTKNKTNTNNNNNNNNNKDNNNTAGDNDSKSQNKATNHRTKGKALGIKLVIDFHIDPVSSGSNHFGGIHFHSPTKYGTEYTNQTPHVYTTSGIIGDNFGPRCFIPTIDSTSVKHRFSHELSIKVTSNVDQGLWTAGCGEHFGVNGVVLHSVPRMPTANSVNAQLLGSTTTANDIVSDDVNRTDKNNIVNPDQEEKAIKEEENMKEILGKESVNFIAKSFAPVSLSASSNSVRGADTHVHIIPSDESNNLNSLQSNYQLATSLWTTSIWSPCPVRSIGFAIGPFKVLYDPEYYGKQENDDEDEEEEGEKDVVENDKSGKSDDDNDEDEDYPTISETALIHGEGIRQLYFAPRDERCHIHSEASVITASGLIDATVAHETGLIYCPSHAKPCSSSIRLEKKQCILSIMGGTSGVPNRALSLMRDILALPSYRTMSYTQVWIPNAVDGGSSCGALHSCPEVSCNPFVGGGIFDATILPPLGRRLPYHYGGRSLQLLQARCAVRGWIRAALPLGGSDEIGYSYIHTLFEELIMTLYEKSHGAFGEGGSKQSFFFTKRFAIGSGLNSRNMDFLPVHNVEEEDFSFTLGGAVGALPAEDQTNGKLWRNATNGTESHTAALDEVLIRQLLNKDILEAIERVDKFVAMPSVGWLGSAVSATFLSSNSTSSSGIGCGSVELAHPIGGSVYRTLKCKSLRRIIEGRAGLSNFIRVVRAAFIAAILDDKGEKSVDLREKSSTKKEAQLSKSVNSNVNISEDLRQKPSFVHSIDELVKRGGMTHGSFIRAMQNISGPIHYPYLSGSLVDVSRDACETSFLQPEGFPNSFVRGSSGLYLRVGTLVDTGYSGDKTGGSNKLLTVSEPVIPNGGIAFGGPVTVRVIENGGQGQCNEYVKTISTDGRRTDWGPIFLHGDPVTSPKQQNAANGSVDSSSRKKNVDKARKKKDGVKSSAALLESRTTQDNSFTQDELHKGGYQALELVRLTNLSPLLWVRVDPQGLYDGRVVVFQQDSCLGEQLFHDGDASSQIEAVRALAERPLPLQGATKIRNVYGVPVAELPVRLLADCLRGSVALHADLPHNPAVRVHAAIAIAQWQNNKAPSTKDSFEWIGLKLLIQYFSERFRKDGKIMPLKYKQVCLKTSNKGLPSSTSGGGQADDSGQYQYLDMYDDPSEREEMIESALDIEDEEDEEYRVRAAVITAISCCRAKDGQSPPLVLSILEEILQGDDESVITNVVTLEEGQLIEKKRARKKVEFHESSQNEEDVIVYTERKLCGDMQELSYSSSSLIGETLLSLCYINACPQLIEDPTTGMTSQSKANHPATQLMQACYRWLQWDLYKEDVRLEAEMMNLTGIGIKSHIAPCAIIGLYSLALLRQVTTDVEADTTIHADENKKRKKEGIPKLIEDSASVHFYMDIFDTRPTRSDITRAAAAQAVTCLCCAIDRVDNRADPIGLLKALVFLLNRILDRTTSPALKQTLALIMLDACTGKVSCNQRVGILTNHNDLITAGTRLLNGPLGASYGNDSGNTIFTSVSELSSPAANAINDGARRGMRLLRTAGKPVSSNKPNQKKTSEQTIVQVAQFASSLWRTMNGELGGKKNEKEKACTGSTSVIDGVCAYDGHLRCTLLAIWQCVWPNSKNNNGHCIAVQRVQSWKAHEGTQKYKDLGADQVMSVDDEEKKEAELGYKANNSFRKIIISEIDRQRWRGEMAKEMKDSSDASKDPTAASQGLNLPLDIVEKDDAWRLGAWVTSAAHQRRTHGTDGGSMVSATKLRLTMKG